MEMSKLSLVLLLAMLDGGLARPQRGIGRLLKVLKDLIHDLRTGSGSVQMDQENHRHVLRVRGAPGPTTAEESDLPERVRVQQQESPPPPPQLPRRLQD